MSLGVQDRRSFRARSNHSPFGARRSALQRRQKPVNTCRQSLDRAREPLLRSEIGQRLTMGDFMIRVVSAIALLAVLFSARPSHAANTDAFCRKDSTGAGSCYGSFTGFQSPGVGYVTFDTRGFDASFVAAYHGTLYSCRAANGSQPLQALIAATSAYRFYFNIQWDANGNCTYLDLQNASWL
jgi:hypothetical protein